MSNIDFIYDSDPEMDLSGSSDDHTESEFSSDHAGLGHGNGEASNNVSLDMSIPSDNAESDFSIPSDNGGSGLPYEIADEWPEFDTDSEDSMVEYNDSDFNLLDNNANEGYYVAMFLQRLIARLDTNL